MVGGKVQLWDKREVTQMRDKLENAGDDYSRSLRRFLSDLEELSPERSLALAPSAFQIGQLRRSFPNFEPAIVELERAAALARLTKSNALWMPPLLLAGDPGVGKTFFASTVAKLCGLPHFEVSLSTNTAGFALTGLHLGWSSGGPGLVYRNLVQGQFANPIGILDEVDKLGSQEKSNASCALLSLLEPSTAGRFRDEAVPIALNASQIAWIATANNLDNIDAPLRSRFTVVEIPKPTPEQVPAIARSVYRLVRERYEWGQHFPHDPDPTVISILAEHTPREMRRALTRAFGNAAIARRTDVQSRDFSNICEASLIQKRIGFY